MIHASHIVLDKSYLQGCTIQDMQEITKEHRLIICAEAYHEVISSPDDERRNCMKKLLTFTDSVDLLDHNGTLLRYEIENWQPSVPLSRQFRPGGLRNITQPQHETIANFHDHWEITGMRSFDEVVCSINANCGRIKPDDIGHKNVVLNAYSQLKVSDERLPPPNMIDENWAIYRRLQVELIAAYEYMCSFQNGQFHIKENKKGHNQLDFRILVTASLARCIATRDKLIKRYFGIICPDGVLYWLRRQQGQVFILVFLK